MTATISLADLTRRPNALAAHYSRFRVGERLLLTGHSHQAWPDVSLEADGAHYGALAVRPVEGAGYYWNERSFR